MYRLHQPNSIDIAASETVLSESVIDLEWLSMQPLLPFLVPILPAPLLHRSLIANGFENSLDVIEWIRGDQLQKVLDFDIWTYSSEIESEDISADKVMSWLEAWLSISPEFAAERFVELEEETICLVLSKIFDIQPEGIAYITEDIRENWWLTMDKKFFLQIRKSEEDTFVVLKQFVDALYGRDIHFAGRLFAYASMLIRQESLEEGLKWRAQRLAEQGFVSKEEALSVLAPKKLRDLKKTVQEIKAVEEKKRKLSEKYPSYFFAIPSEFAAAQYEPEQFDAIIKLLSSFEIEDGVRYMQLALGAEKLQNILGHPSATPESFYDDEDFLHETAENILKVSHNILLNLEFRALHKNSSELLIEKALLKIAADDKAILSGLKQSISYLANCVMAGAGAHPSADPITHSILVTRGAINIGLELCLNSPAEYGLNLTHADRVDNAVDCVVLLGPSFLFRLGWNALFEVSHDLTLQIIELDAAHPLFKGKLSTTRSVKLSDEERIAIPLDKLLVNLRFADMERWLSTCEHLFSAELFFTFEALLSRMPLYPATLTGASQYISQKTKPFETLQEVSHAAHFVKNLKENLDHMHSDASFV